MADTERKVLLTHRPRGTTTASGCASAFFIVFGLPFMAAGVLLGLVARGVIPARHSASFPDWVPQVMAVIFFAPGLFVSLMGVDSFLKNRRTRARQAEHPTEPWLVDAWEPEGTRDRPRATLGGQLGMTAFLALFLSPFNYVVFLQPQQDVPFFAKALVGLFDFILVLMIVGILSTLWHRARYGRSRLAFGSFPFFLGQGMNVRLTTGRPLGAFKNVVFTLRCIEERSETRRTTRGSTSSQTHCDQLWAEVVTLNESWALNEGEIPVSFHLPEGDLGTRLAESPARYWEIEVTADTPGLDYSAVFPVPVYARPRA